MRPDDHRSLPTDDARGDNESNPPAPGFFGVWYGLGTKGGVFELSV